jgi:hypothetical protein
MLAISLGLGKAVRQLNERTFRIQKALDVLSSWGSLDLLRRSSHTRRLPPSDDKLGDSNGVEKDITEMLHKAQDLVLRADSVGTVEVTDLTCQLTSALETQATLRRTLMGLRQERHLRVAARWWREQHAEELRRLYSLVTGHGYGEVQEEGVLTLDEAYAMLWRAIEEREALSDENRLPEVRTHVYWTECMGTSL